MKTLGLILFICMLFQTVSAQSGDKSQMKILDLAKAFSNQQETPLSKFVKTIKYVPLETNSQALLSGIGNYEVSDKYIICKDYNNGENKILLFDRETGKFLRQIGKQGQGPGEYRSTGYLPYNSIKKEFYALGVREIFMYDLTGKYIDKIKYPAWTNPKEYSNLPITRELVFKNMLDGDTFVGYCENTTGTETRKIVLLSKNGYIKVYPNYQTFKRGNTFINGPETNFYKWGGNLYFIETFCDTLYQITKDALVPRYYFDWGKNNAPYSMQAEIGYTHRWQDFFFIMNISENKNYIFFNIDFSKQSYTGFIEKRSDRVTFCKILKSGISGIYNDIDGLMDIIPYCFTQDNKMVYIIQPVKLVKWLRENPDKAVQAKAKYHWLNDIDELSNPVIAIANCIE